MNGFINCTQKQGTNIRIKEEQGITLIALLVTVILLVILVGVAVSQITGDEGIIVGTEEAVDDYKYQQYKEQIEQLVHSIILADSLAGRTTTVTSMAEDMEQESWIKSAVPNEESKDIIVTVDKGYVYQVYYDELTGMLEIEGIGKDDGSSYPTLTAYYDETKGTVEATASCEGGIARIELIYKGEVVQTANTETASFEVTETGWYKVKAIANNGNERYANVRVTGKIKAPIIAITSSGEKENSWYGKDNVPVEVTISTEDEKVAGINYKKNTDENYTYVEGKNTKLTINTAGRIIIYAYAVDTEGNETEISSLEIKYDNVKPNVGEIAVTPEVPASGWYTNNIEITLPNMSDSNSGIAGYYYWEVTGDVADILQEEKTYVSGETGKVIVESEGEKTIAFQAKDNAGNISSMSSITIRKDSTPPDDFTPSITNETATRFTINGTSSDSTSGLAGYYFYVDGILQNSEISTSGIYNVTGLNANKTYSVYMEAVDKAGNKKKSTSITAKTNGELLKPKISLSGEQGENGYYKGNVTVTIEDSASEDITGTNQIRYQVTGSNQIGETTINGRTATFEITIDGTSTITAQAVSKDGNVSETETQTVNKDSTPPTASLTAGTVGETSIEVTANGNDSASGIASYEFQRSTTSATSGFTSIETITNSNTTNTYTYSGLTSGTTYYLKVIVKDKAGNTQESNIVTSKTKEAGIDFGGMTEDEIENNYVGKYVDYIPTAGSFVAEGQYSGYTTGSIFNMQLADQTLSTNTLTKWIIFEIKENTLSLISDTIVNSGFNLKGANGYNNGVLLLNNACKTMYSNSNLGTIGRSLNIDDIERHSNFDKTKYDDGYYYYGREYSSEGTNGYPSIFALEKTGAVDGKYGTKYDLSQQDEYITGTTQKAYKGRYTAYSYSMSSTYISEKYLNLFAKSEQYWLASRCTNYTDGDLIGGYQLGFNLFYITSKNEIAPSLLYYSLLGSNGASGIRPIVEIDLSKVNIGATGDGSSGTPYSITAK